jgi:hypothetical protein
MPTSGRDLLPLVPIEPTIMLMETGDFNAGDGSQAVLAADHVRVTVRLEDHEVDIWIPVVRILDALQQQGTVHGN